MIESTTGTNIESYLEWLKKELNKKQWGEVSIKFTICRGFVTDVQKGSIDSEHYALPKQ